MGVICGGWRGAQRENEGCECKVESGASEVRAREDWEAFAKVRACVKVKSQREKEVRV